jgi:membrane complex biogenesis BtpA family protein
MFDFSRRKQVFGLIHLKPLPGTPFYEEGDFELSMEKALAGVRALARGGADGCLIQTVDRVYPPGDDTDYTRLAAMTLICHEARRAAGPGFTLGVQLMWNCITPSLAVAKVCKADFIRCTALTGTAPSPFGTIEAEPLKVQNYRKAIGAGNIGLLAEIQGYHTGQEDPSRITNAAFLSLMAGADVLEVYHAEEEINEKLVRSIKNMPNPAPVVLGGGTNLENVKRRMRYADGVLVGSCFEGGNWGGQIDPEIVREYMALLRSL